MKDDSGSHAVAREIGTPRRAANRLRRAREGPELAHAGRKGDLTSCRGTVQSAWQVLPVRREEGRPALSWNASG